MPSPSFTSTLTLLCIATVYLQSCHGIVIPDGLGEPKDLNMNVSERIKHWGYPSMREYTVTTDDGYMIYVQRIQNGRFKPFDDSISKPLVFLQHGLMSSSSSWVINLPGQSLAYLLADAGYDVWLGNVRGNRYGMRHTTMNKRQRKFWDFTWTDMAAHDLPAMIDFALATSGQKKVVALAFPNNDTLAADHHLHRPLAGHDGRLCTLLDERNVDMFIAIAPVATLGNVKGGFIKMVPFLPLIKSVLATMGDYALGGVQWILHFFKPICLKNTVHIKTCDNVYFAVLATDQFKFINQSRMPLIIKGFPDDTSMKNLAHFAQMVKSDKFEEYNYGVIGNYRSYKKVSPPTFDLSRITVPIELYYSTKDTLADAHDIETNLIPNLTTITHIVKSETFQHSDYIIAMSATQHVYMSVMTTIAKIVKNGQA